MPEYSSKAPYHQSRTLQESVPAMAPPQRSQNATSRRRSGPASQRQKESQPRKEPKGLPTGVQWITVEPDMAGQRLDNFLMARLRGIPRSKIYRIVRKGEVRVNKGRVKPETRLQAGDQVRIPPVVKPERPTSSIPGDRVQTVMEHAVVFESEDLLVVNKPSGIAVHGGSGLSFGLIEVLRAARPEARFLELVHRLDRDTSGLVMIAKKRSTLRFLQDELRRREVHKHYHALVSGHWSAGVSQVAEPLLRFELANGERRVRVDAEGKPSLTRYRVLDTWPGYSLVEASPVTGRTHQIRVHCAFAGHPIAGDDKYMDAASQRVFRRLGGNRLMLHAHALEFRLPDSEQWLRLEAPYDEAFTQVLAGLTR